MNIHRSTVLGTDNWRWTRGTAAVSGRPSCGATIVHQHTKLYSYGCLGLTKAMIVLGHIKLRGYVCLGLTKVRGYVRSWTLSCEVIITQGHITLRGYDRSIKDHTFGAQSSSTRRPSSGNMINFWHITFWRDDHEHTKVWGHNRSRAHQAMGLWLFSGWYCSWMITIYGQARLWGCGRSRKH